MEGEMTTLRRRDALRGLVGAAALSLIPSGASAKGDPLMEALNRFGADRDAFDAYHTDLDSRGDHLSDKDLHGYWGRSKALMRAAVGLPAAAGSSLVVLDLLAEEMEVGQSIHSDAIAQLVGAVRVYIASTARSE
jgi:hypothetical protein